jgi:nucleoside triphosphatase
MKKEYPEPTVGALIVNDKKQILLTKSHKWKNRFTIPGGHVELGETTEEALKREIKEEVGLDIKPIRFLLMQEVIYSEEFYKPKHFIFLDYLCEAETTDVKLNKNEIQEFIWVNPRKALGMNVDTFTKRTIRKYLEIKD